jgi:hypothetical protein
MHGNLADVLIELSEGGGSTRSIASALQLQGVFVSHVTVKNWLDQLVDTPEWGARGDASPLTERLLRFVAEQPNGCWLWTGALNASGYGYLSGDLDDGKGRRRLLAHRVAYQSLVGPVSDGLVLDHLCHVRSCCNPRHLEPVHQDENYRRGRLMARYHGAGLRCPFDLCRTCAEIDLTDEAAA